MQNSVQEKLKRELDQALHGAYLKAKSLGYTATEFFHMLTTMRGVLTAKTLINKPRSTGYRRLWEMGHWPAPGSVDTRLSESRLHLELYGT